MHNLFIVLKNLKCLIKIQNYINPGPGLNAGYDPHALILYFQRVGEGNTHLVGIDDILNNNSNQNTINQIYTITDEHPSNLAPIRLMSTAITELQRRGTITNIPTLTRLNNKFKSCVKTETH